jgi:Uma2 family endonuclease
MATSSSNWLGGEPATETFLQGAAPMSTAERPTIPALPPLVAGQRLDRATFHARYEAMPPRTRAELIGGVVYMPPMLGSDHGDDHVPVAGIFFIYQSATLGVRANIESTTVLDEWNEVQPDCSLRILEASGGQTRTIPKWIEGAPELVVEIARSSRSKDLGPKLEEYQRAGVREYVVLALDPDEVYWYEGSDEGFIRSDPGEDGVYRSKVFPGLWFDPAAFFRGDALGLIATLERGLASPEHAEFVDQLARRRAGG